VLFTIRKFCIVDDGTGCSYALVNFYVDAAAQAAGSVLFVEEIILDLQTPGAWDQLNALIAFHIAANVGAGNWTGDSTGADPSNPWLQNGTPMPSAPLAIAKSVTSDPRGILSDADIVANLSAVIGA
jgi:hypothetical protein